jgi:histidinol-phosphate aminotransferase
LEEQGVVYQQVNEIIEEKTRLLEEIKNVKFIKKIYKSDANFFMIKVDNGTRRYEQLLKLGIVVRNTSKYYNCKNTLRITVGKKDENNALIKSLYKMED